MILNNKVDNTGMKEQSKHGDDNDKCQPTDEQHFPVGNRQRDNKQQSHRYRHPGPTRLALVQHKQQGNISRQQDHTEPPAFQCAVLPYLRQHQCKANGQRVIEKQADTIGTAIHGMHAVTGIEGGDAGKEVFEDEVLREANEGNHKGRCQQGQQEACDIAARSQAEEGQQEVDERVEDLFTEGAQSDMAIIGKNDGKRSRQQKNQDGQREGAEVGAHIPPERGQRPFTPQDKLEQEDQHTDDQSNLGNTEGIMAVNRLL